MSFLCPECGSDEVGMVAMVETDPNGSDIWDSVFERINCGKCKSVVPAHLGERWDGMSVERAKLEWQEQYRKRGRKRKA
jgi:hypothetical protein